MISNRSSACCIDKIAIWGLIDTTEADVRMIDETLYWIECHCKEPTYYKKIHKGNYKQVVSFD